MANSRPESMIIPDGIFDETNGKHSSIKMNGRSSTSSMESTSGKNIRFNEQQSTSQTRLSTATSSTTTDSDFESEQDEKQHKNGSHRLSRRVRQLHKLFKSEIPEPMPQLINSYVCAYQGDILLQGKMFITDRYLCFHSRIINYVTKHVYRWEQISSVRKERVAFIFPTAICIHLKSSGKKIVYASFIQRDQAFDTILSVLANYTNDVQVYDDEDDTDGPHDGTLKANNQQDKFNRDSHDGTEPDVLQMCMTQSQRRAHSVPKKIDGEKQSNKKSHSGKTSSKNSNHDQKPPTRPSRFIKNDQKTNDSNKRHSTKADHRSHSTPRIQPTEEIASPPINNPSMTNTNSNEKLNIILSFISQIKPYLQSYPMKITMIVLLILTLLFFHAFYLVKVAFRIENRLQSLHHQWPSTSSMKNSFSSNIKDL